MRKPLLKQIIIKSIKTMWAIFVTVVLLLAILVSLLKIFLPYADNYKRDIEAYLLTNFNADISIGSIGASWQQTGPAIVLNDVTLSATEEAPLDISIMETKVNVDFWRSLQEQRLVTGSFQLNGINTYLNSDVFFKVRPQSQGSQLFESLSHLFLAQIQQFQVTDSTVIVRHQDGHNQTFQIDNLSWLNDGNRHRGQGDVYIDGFSDNSLSIRMDLYGQRRSEIFGQIYLEAQQVDITPWLTQFIGEHIAVKSTEGNFRVWSDVSDGLVNQILMDVKNTGVRWNKQNVEKFMFIDNAALRWKQSGDNWRLSAKNITLKTEQQSPAPFNLNLLRRKKQMELRTSNVDLNAITQLFSLFSATKNSNLLANTEVNGNVNAMHVVWPDNSPMKAWFDVSQFSFLPQSEAGEAYLGLKDLNLKGAWSGDLGRINIKGAFGALETRDTFIEPINYERLEIDADLRVNDFGLDIWLPNIFLKNDDISLRATTQFSLFDESHLKVYAEVLGPKQGKIANYLPKYLIGKDTYDYLVRSIQEGAGKLTQVIIDGKADQIPYDEPGSNGTFIVKAQLADTLFKFSQDWPALEDLNATLTVDKKDMFIDAHSAEIGGLIVRDDVRAKIDLAAKSTLLELDITPKNFELTDFHHLVETTALKETLGEVFEFVKLQGNGDVQVHLSIPLSDETNEEGVVPEFSVKGNVVTQSAQLSLPSLDLTFADLKSQVSFENSAFAITADKASWLSLPVDFSVIGGNSDDGYKIDGKVNGTWSDKVLKAAIDGPVSGYYDGDLFNSVTLSVNIGDDDKYQYFADAIVDLTDAEYQLTGGLNKKKSVPAAINISVVGDEKSNDVYIDLKDQLKFYAKAPTQSGVAEQAMLAIGQPVVDQALELPEKGFEIDIGLADIEFNSTLGFVLDLIDSLPSGSSTEEPFLSSPTAISGQFGTVRIFGQTWNDVALVAKPEEFDWLFEVNSELAKVRVIVPENIDTKGLTINADYLHIKNTESDEAASISDNSSDTIRGIPTLNITCALCTYNDKPLGRVTLNTFTRNDSLFIEKAQMEYQRNTLNLTGIWAGNSGSGKTTITGDIYSRYFGPWMLEWGLNTGIKQSDLKSRYSLSWNGAPFDFNYASLNGEMSFELGEGYLSEVSDQGARIFSLFSLNSLYRKLKFDFNDVFQKGLFYNDIKGSLMIEQGVAFSEDIRMDGVAGNMNMRGFTDLNQNTLDYDVTFKPKITSSIPVIAAWLAPGSAGLSLLAGIAIDKIIEKADVVSEVRLKINGDLSDPKVQEVKRFTKTISIPKEQQANPTEAEQQPSMDKSKEDLNNDQSNKIESPSGTQQPASVGSETSKVSEDKPKSDNRVNR